MIDGFLSFRYLTGTMVKRFFAPLLLLLLIHGQQNCLAQIPYRLHAPEEYITAAGLIGFNIGGNILYKHKSGLSPDEISSLNNASINAFDRPATLRYSRTAAQISDDLLFLGLVTPTTLFIGKEFRHDDLAVSVMALESILLTAAEVQLVKGLVKRNRPFVYNPSAPLSEKRKPDATASFFSGHTALTATAAMYTASVYTSTHPNRSRDPWIWAGAAALPIATGYFRYRAGKHFPTDVLAGLLIGSLNGILIPQLHKR